MIRRLLPLLVLLGWTGASAGDERPNVLLITVDDMNCDSVGAFGYAVPGTTPNRHDEATGGRRRPAAVGCLGRGRDRGEAPGDLMAVEKRYKVIVERHPDGYVAYPLGLKGVVVGQGDSYEDALADVRSAIRFHLETFGPDALEDDSPVLEAFVAEAGVAP